MTTYKSPTMALLVGLLYLILIPISWIIQGFVLKTLWNWHLASLVGFNISTAHALGIGILISSATHQWTYKPEELSPRQERNMVLSIMLTPFWFLFIGYLALLMR